MEYAQLRKVHCSECGGVILYKKRGKKIIQLEAR